MQHDGSKPHVVSCEKNMATHPSRDTGKPANPKFFEIVIKILHDEINKVKTPQLDGW
jgi:hypothetical protein